jgi:hypothetical protein
MSGGISATNSGSGDDDIMFGSIVFPYQESSYWFRMAAPGGTIYQSINSATLETTTYYPGGSVKNPEGSYTITIGGNSYLVSFSIFINFTAPASSSYERYNYGSWCAVKQ